MPAGVSRGGTHSPQLYREIWMFVHLRTVPDHGTAVQCLSAAACLLQIPTVPSMELGAFDTLEIFESFIILVILNLDRYSIKLQYVLFQCLHYHLIHSFYDNS